MLKGLMEEKEFQNTSHLDKKFPQILERHASRGASFILFAFLPKIANLQGPLKHALYIEMFL